MKLHRLKIKVPSDVTRSGVERHTARRLIERQNRDMKYATHCELNDPSKDENREMRISSQAVLPCIAWYSLFRSLGLMLQM